VVDQATACLGDAALAAFAMIAAARDRDVVNRAKDVSALSGFHPSRKSLWQRFAPGLYVWKG
jgi:hypothetical protein